MEARADRGPILVTILAVLCPVMVFSPARPSRGDVPDLSRFEGTWHYADGAQGMQQIERGIDQAVRGMPFFLAPIARDLVRGRTVPHRELYLDVRGEELRFGTEAWGPVSSRLNGPRVPIVAPDGTHLDLIQRTDRAGRIVQIFDHPEGIRENMLALSGDGAWLWMAVRIHSPRLPRDCRYRVRYRRG